MTCSIMCPVYCIHIENGNVVMTLVDVMAVATSTPCVDLSHTQRTSCSLRRPPRHSAHLLLPV